MAAQVGKDNFNVDREAGDLVLKAMPALPLVARSLRRFLSTTVSELAAEGIGQFLDIGTGLPTAENTHEVAQRLAPESRIVYVDHDHCKSCCAHTFGAVQREESNTEAIRSERPWAAE